MTHKHGKAGGAHDHAEDGEPNVGHADGRVQAVPDAQHVTHGFEQGIGVLLTPGVILEEKWRRKEKLPSVSLLQRCCSIVSVGALLGVSKNRVQVVSILACLLETITAYI